MRKSWVGITEGAWVMTESGWRHRPWWKVAINTVLRRIQKDKPEQWLVVTKSFQVPRSMIAPFVIGYGFQKVEVGHAP